MIRVTRLLRVPRLSLCLLAQVATNCGGDWSSNSTSASTEHADELRAVRRKNPAPTLASVLAGISLGQTYTIDAALASASKSLSKTFTCTSGSGTVKIARPTVTATFADCTTSGGATVNGAASVTITSVARSSIAGTLSLDLAIAKGGVLWQIDFDGTIVANSSGQTVNGQGTVAVDSLEFDVVVTGLHHGIGDCYPDDGTISGVAPVGIGSVSVTATFDLNTADSGVYERCEIADLNGDGTPEANWCNAATLPWSC